MTAAAEVQKSRRPPRRVRVAVDPEHFAPDVDDALAAFADDVSYAVQIARAAVAIGHKRKARQARRDLLDLQEQDVR